MKKLIILFASILILAGAVLIVDFLSGDMFGARRAVFQLDQVFEKNNVSLTQVATTTIADPPVAGYYCNSGADVLIENFYLDISVSNGLWQSNWTVGTTTCTVTGPTCGDGSSSFVSTTTASLYPSFQIATTTTDIFDRDSRTVLGTYYDGGANATSTPFLLATNDCIVVHSDHSQATSSASYTSAGGFTELVGGFHFDATIR